MSDLPESPALVAADVILDDEPSESMKSRRTLGVGFWIAIAWLVIIVLAAILAPYLGLKDPDENYINRDLGRPPYPPSSDFWFGSDNDAKDVFSRTIYGARVSLTVGFAAIAAGMLFGGTLGLLAGYLRGWFDRVISFAFLVLLSFPALVLAILITALLDRSLRTVAGTLGFL
ncbi:MAG: hypothetical protein RLN74_15500, partial [Ilumatobacter fluminis]